MATTLIVTTICGDKFRDENYMIKDAIFEQGMMEDIIKHSDFFRMNGTNKLVTIATKHIVSIELMETGVR